MKLGNSVRAWWQEFFAKTVRFVAGAGLLVLTITGAHANTVTWATSGGTAWMKNSNWTGGYPPGPTDVAQFGAYPNSSTIIGIDLGNSVLNNGINNEAVGAIEATSARVNKLTIGNSSTTASGTLTLKGATVNGVDHVVLRNGSNGKDLVIQDSGSSGTLNQNMTLALGDPVENLVVLDSAGALVISDVIASSSGTTPLTFTGVGAGTISVTNPANTFTGNIKVTGTELDIIADGSLGNTANNLTLNGGRFGIVSGVTVILSSTRAISIATNTIINVPGAAGVLAFNGVIADCAGSTGVLIKQNTGLLCLGGVNTFSGNVLVNGGTLQLTNGSDRLPTGATLYLGQVASSSVGALDLNGNKQTLAGLVSVPGNNFMFYRNMVTNTSATVSTLTLAGGGAYVFGNNTTTNSGILCGPINLVVKGSGTNTFGDADNYTGTTLITNTATLAVSASGTITGTPQLSIAAGAMFDVSAAGFSFGASQTLAGGSSSGTANLKATGKTVTLACGAKLSFHAVGGNSPSVGKISDTGALTLNTNAVTVCVDSGILGPGTYRLLDCAGTLTGLASNSATITGAGSLPSGATATISTTTGTAGHIDLVVSKGNANVALTSTANPCGFNNSLSFTATLPSDATGKVVFSSTNGPFSTNVLGNGSATSGILGGLPRGTNLITAVYSGDGNYLGSQGTLNEIVTNHPPTAATVSYFRNAGIVSLHIAIADLLTNVTDADGDPITLAGTSSSTNGIALTNGSGYLSYRNTNAVNDQFLGAVTDGFGGTNVVTVNLVLRASTVGGQTQGLSLTGDRCTATLCFAGIPGYGYAVQRSTNLVDWVDILQTNVPANGAFQCLDNLGPNPPAQAYYRLRCVP